MREELLWYDTAVVDWLLLLVVTMEHPDEQLVTWSGVNAKDSDFHDHCALNKNGQHQFKILNTLAATYKDFHDCCSPSQHTHHHCGHMIQHT